MKYEVIEVPVEDIFFDRDFNCRSFTIDSTASLAKSIEKHGLFAPIILQPFGGPYKYRIVAGHRRYAAMRYHLRREKIPAFICEAGEEANLAENLDRRDLTLWEQAEAINKQFPGRSLREIARALNRSPNWVWVRTCLMKMPQEIKQLAASGQLNGRQLDAVYHCKKDRVEFARGLAVNRPRTTRRRPNVLQIREMLRELAGRGEEGKVMQFGLWVLGDISKEEILGKSQE